MASNGSFSGYLSQPNRVKHKPPLNPSTAGRRTMKSGSWRCSLSACKQDGRPNRPMTTFGESIPAIDDEVELAIELTVAEFSHGPRFELSFPSSLTSDERLHVHKVAAKYRLGSVTQTKDNKRIVYVFKNESLLSKSLQAASPVIGSKAIMIIQSLFNGNTYDRRRTMESEQMQLASVGGPLPTQCITGKLSQIIPQVPPPNKTGPVMQQSRTQLAIGRHRITFLDALEKHQVVIVAGEAGAGKSTQIPQYILENCNRLQRTCCVVSSQPSRVDALGLADRIAIERGEQLGQTIGFQIRLESKMSPRTLLTVCTNSVLLRTLIGSQQVLNSVSHIILDQLECRDCCSELLLLFFRQVIASSLPHIKLVLLTNTWMARRLSSYFNEASMILISGNRFEPDCLMSMMSTSSHHSGADCSLSASGFYLEDVLQLTGYLRPIVQNLYTGDLNHAIERQKRALSVWLRFLSVDDKCLNVPVMNRCNQFSRPNMHNSSIGAELDKLLQDCWFENIDIGAQRFINVLLGSQVSIDYTHSDTGMSLLMIAVCRRRVSLVEYLLKLGVDLRIRTINDFDAFGWSRLLNYTEITSLLLTYMHFDKIAEPTQRLTTFSQPCNELLVVYQHMRQPPFDYDLVLELLTFICMQLQPHSKSMSTTILVCLPEYDHLVQLRQMLIERTKTTLDCRLILLSVHAHMSLADRKRLFQPAQPDQRKLVLITATDEPHITLPDVAYIVDCTSSGCSSTGIGVSSRPQSQIEILMRRQSTRHSTNASIATDTLKLNRPNANTTFVSLPICFHLCTRSQVEALTPFPASQLQVNLPDELCLAASLLADENCERYLSKALDAPSPLAVKSSLKRLQILEALDYEKRLSELGVHMLDLPISPSLAKSVLVASVLKCLDPVLTICCILAVDHWPFHVPFEHVSKRVLRSNRMQLADRSYSEHLILLRVFQSWQRARSENDEQSFVERVGLRVSAMQQAVGLRAQVLGQLRASGFIKTRGAGDIKDLNAYSQHWPVVKAALSVGKSFDILRFDRNRGRFILANDQEAHFRPGSLFEQISVETNLRTNPPPSDWLVASRVTGTPAGQFAECCTLVTPVTLALFASFSNHSVTTVSSCSRARSSDVAKSTPVAERRSDHHLYHADDSESDHELDKTAEVKWQLQDGHRFRLPPTEADLLMRLRLKWKCLLKRRMAAPSRLLTLADEALVKTIVSLLNEEEKLNGIAQLVGIGDRPIQFSCDFCSSYVHEPTGLAKTSHLMTK